MKVGLLHSAYRIIFEALCCSEVARWFEHASTKHILQIQPLFGGKMNPQSTPVKCVSFGQIAMVPFWKILIKGSLAQLGVGAMSGNEAE